MAVSSKDDKCFLDSIHNPKRVIGQSVFSVHYSNFDWTSAAYFLLILRGPTRHVFSQLSCVVVTLMIVRDGGGCDDDDSDRWWWL